MPLPRKSEEQGFHWVYRTGAHDPRKKDQSAAPVFHASCNSCLTELQSSTPEDLNDQLEDHRTRHETELLQDQDSETTETRGGDAFRDVKIIGTQQNLPRIPPTS